MWRIRRGNLGVLCLLMVVFVMVGTPSVLATTANSPNFEASEAEFGAGAALESCSGQYCAQATIGGIGGDDTSSQNFTASFSASDEDEEPLLEIMIEPGEANLGKLDTNRTATRTMLLHVNSHRAGGYIVQVTGAPPSFNGYSLTTPIEPIASIQGSEQFGINVTANTTPTIGADPVLLPDESATPGVVLPKYGTPNTFSYINGDVVARTNMESSKIRYTISMIVNVAGSTPAGHYSGDFSAFVTPDF